MNAKTVIAAIALGFVSLTGCQVRQVHTFVDRVVPASPAPVVTPVKLPDCPAPLVWNAAIHGCDMTPAPAVTVPVKLPDCPAPLVWNPAIHGCDTPAP